MATVCFGNQYTSRTFAIKYLTIRIYLVSNRRITGAKCEQRLSSGKQLRIKAYTEGNAI
jgi:hypothetical protein